MASSHNTLQKYDAFIVDSEMSARMRLKQVCASVVNFGRVTPLGLIQEAQARLVSEQPVDVIFVSNLFGQEAISKFIKDCKATKQGQDSAYILVMKSSDQGNAAVAQSVMIGADGVLFEPYSVDILVEITVLSARVRGERSVAREEAAIKLLLSDVTKQIDLIAYSRACGTEMGQAIKLLRQACAVIGDLDEKARQLYYKLVVDVFEAAPIPQNIGNRKAYGGASSRVKKKMVEKVNAELDKMSGPAK